MSTHDYHPHFTTEQFLAWCAEVDAEDTECQGHPAGSFDLLGQTVYCDGTCRPHTAKPRAHCDGSCGGHQSNLGTGCIAHLDDNTGSAQ